MNKIILAVVGLVGAASAFEQHIHADVFSPHHFIKETTPINLFNSLVSDIQGKIVKDGHVTWGECPAKNPDVYISDSTQTYCEPDPLAKGDTITFYLGGLLTQDIKMSNTAVSVQWNGTPLYKADFPINTIVHANENFNTKLTWWVPGFAPSGHYTATVNLSGKTVKGGEDSVVNCLTADFDL